MAIALVPSPQSTEPAHAESTPRAQPTTLEASSLPRVPDRDRRRATATLKRLVPGRYLAVEDGDELIVFELSAEVTHIGRSPGVDVVLDDPSVSRRHAVIAIRGAQAMILDDRSLNGIAVNGARVGEAPLRHGDRITLGRLTLRYVEVGAGG